MMSQSQNKSIDVRYVARLARIALTDEEVERFGKQLGDLLDHVNVLSELDTASVPATAQVVESRNVEREDVAGECLDRETVLSMAPQRQGAFFRVPRIIAEEG
jgi:aspartyl-tRNA(Asn)/glutamyl-tRNA(Gln) amidotransferase subunit C